MKFTSIPIIVTISYLVGEIFKLIFKKRRELYKIIPVFVAILGGILGIIMYYTSNNLLSDVDNLWVAMEIGIVSGASATNTNQIIKQLWTKVQS